MVNVKPLEWEPHSVSMEKAESVLGRYVVEHSGIWWLGLDGQMTKTGASIETAKAAAQADYATRILSALTYFTDREPEGWQPIETAPRDKTSVIIAVPEKDLGGHIVGEAYFDPEHHEDGDWWWANTDHGDYHGGPISEINFHGPSHWQPLPAPPALAGNP